MRRLWVRISNCSRASLYLWGARRMVMISLRVRQRHGAGHLGTGTLRGFHDALGGSVEHLVIECLQADSDFLLVRHTEGLLQRCNRWHPSICTHTAGCVASSQEKSPRSPQGCNAKTQARLRHTSMLSDESPDFIESDYLHHSSQAKPAICGFIVCHVTARVIITAMTGLGKGEFFRKLHIAVGFAVFLPAHLSAAKRATVSANLRNLACTRPLTESSGHAPSA